MLTSSWLVLNFSWVQRQPNSTWSSCSEWTNKYNEGPLVLFQDGIVDPVDSTLRDFCGRCVREFLKWSIKQTTPQQQEKSPVNTKSLFKRLYSLALHPNAFKRLGASLAFNNIYREFRYGSKPGSRSKTLLKLSVGIDFEEDTIHPCKHISCFILLCTACCPVLWGLTFMKV